MQKKYPVSLSQSVSGFSYTVKKLQSCSSYSRATDMAIKNTVVNQKGDVAPNQ